MSLGEALKQLEDKLDAAFAAEAPSSGEHAAQTAAPEIRQGAEQELPRPTQAELAARADLQREPVCGQYRRLADRIASLASAGGPVCLLLVAAEKEPHVADVLMRVALLLSQRDGRRVLLVDGDPAHRRLSAGLNVDSQAGFCDVLAQGDDWKTLVRPTATGRVGVLPAGSHVTQATPQCVEDVERLLSEWKQTWPVVLMGAAHAGSALTRSLAKACDAVFLLVRLGQTESAAASSALDELRGAGGRVLGCVVTNVPRETEEAFADL